MAERKTNTFYDSDQVRETIESLGVVISAETATDFLCYCPFHANTYSPAFTVGKTNGLYMCHNASCSANRGGTLIGLAMMLSNKNKPEVLRFILSKRSSIADLSKQLEKIAEPEDVKTIDITLVEQFEQKFWSAEKAIDYMHSRGFNDETLKYFRVGYDPKMSMVIVPIFDRNGLPVGFNGRSIEHKKFRLSREFPRNEILFNVHNAKRHGGTAIICESQFDVMRIHQAGFPNAICSFGSHISDNQVRIMQRYFDRIIIMTDADSPGRKSGHDIASKVRGVHIEWAIHDWGVIYPHNAKDAGDMTDEEIKHCINNAVSDVSYRSYAPLAANA